MVANTIYNDGSKYGDADAIYQKFTAALLLAQSFPVRETGLKVSVIDQRVNRWSLFTGAYVDTQALYMPVNAHRAQTDPLYYSYRGSITMCMLTGGNIV